MPLSLSLSLCRADSESFRARVPTVTPEGFWERDYGSG